MNHLIAQAIVVAVVIFLLYKGAKNAPLQITPKPQKTESKLLPVFFASGGGQTTPIHFTSLEELRTHPMFDIWNSEYVLKQPEDSVSVFMVKEGDEVSEGTVVGWLVEISTKRYFS
jgi:hypothetical protein